MPCVPEPSVLHEFAPATCFQKYAAVTSHPLSAVLCPRGAFHRSQLSCTSLPPRLAFQKYAAVTLRPSSSHQVALCLLRASHQNQMCVVRVCFRDLLPRSMQLRLRIRRAFAEWFCLSSARLPAEPNVWHDFASATCFPEVCSFDFAELSQSCLLSLVRASRPGPVCYTSLLPRLVSKSVP